MKYTDKYFKFPIKMFISDIDPNADDQDEYSDPELRKLMIRQPNKDKYKDFIICTKRVLVENIVEYNDDFSAQMTVEMIKKRGLNITQVITEHSSHMCAWSIDRFEEELNKHVESLKGVTE